MVLSSGKMVKSMNKIHKKTAAKCEFSPLNPLSKSNYALKCSGHSVFPDKFNNVFPFFDNCYHDACYVCSIGNNPAPCCFHIHSCIECLILPFTEVHRWDSNGSRLDSVFMSIFFFSSFHFNFANDTFWLATLHFSIYVFSSNKVCNSDSKVLYSLHFLSVKVKIVRCLANFWLCAILHLQRE